MGGGGGGGENDDIFDHTLYTEADSESFSEGCNFELVT